MKKSLFTLALAFAGFSVVAQSLRLCLYEEFTGETCPPCASANPALNALLAQPTNTPKVVAIKWQVPIPSAPTKTWSLYQTNKTEINWRYQTYGYGINSAPSGKMDGQNVTVFGAGSNHPNNLNSTVISTAQSYTSAFTITMNRAWTPGCTAVNLTVNIQATAPFTSVGNLVFRTVMVERLIQFSVQPGTNGEKDFEDVAIKSFPTIQSGVALPTTWTNGQTMTFTLNCPVPSYTRKKSEIAFVGFIQDDGDRKVAQAARLDKAPVPAEAIAAIGASVGVTCSNAISPKVSVRNDGNSAISNLTITPYTDGIAAAPFIWTGNLAPNTSTVITLTGVTTATTNGAHLFSFDITMPVSLYNLTQNINSVSYLVASGYQSTPVAEGFVSATYPPTGWTMVNNDQGPTWTRYNGSGGFNLTFESTKYDFFNNTKIGDADELYLPPANLSGSGDPVLNFDIAYAQRTAASNDKLEIFASDNCGVNWTSVFSASGSSLTTIAPVPNNYVPDPNDASHWRTENLTLTGFNKSSVLVKFVATSGNGNNLYLDNINLEQKSGGTGLNENNAASSLLVYPNPSHDVANIKITSANSGNARVSILNTLGQVVYEKNISVHAGSTIIHVDLKQLANGIYTVVFENGGTTSKQKLTIE